MNLLSLPRDSWQRAVAVLLFVGLASQSACDRRQAPKKGEVHIARKPRPAIPAVPSAALPPAALPATAANDPNVPDVRYQDVVLPILLKHGCYAGPCHGMTRGGGFQFSSGEKTDPYVYKQILSRIDRQDPPSSELLVKSTRKVPHNGGRNFSEDSCDYKRIIAWIGNQPDLKCSDDPPPDPARFAREVAPAFQALGCVGCHSQMPGARARFDLTSLSHSPPETELARQAVAFTNPSPYMTWAASIIKAANAADGKHTQQFDRRSCAYRRLYGYLGNAPELHCEIDPPDQPNKSAAPLPDFPRFVDTVLPAIGRRGCFDTGCHGGGAGGMTLYGKTSFGSDGWHEYLMLLARVEDLKQPEKSTLVTTVRNEQPHGGGERLGGPGDCIDDEVTTWLYGKPRVVCNPPPMPTFERFVKEVQPVLDRMTCTQSRCHGESLPKFVLKRHPATPALLMANYKSALKEVDSEFMPFSGIQLRMREPCAYSVVGAWITNKPKPSCVLRDPDPKIFPKMEDDLRAKNPPTGSPT